DHRLSGFDPSRRVVVDFPAARIVLHRARQALLLRGGSHFRCDGQGGVCRASTPVHQAVRLTAASLSVAGSVSGDVGPIQFAGKFRKRSGNLRTSATPERAVNVNTLGLRAVRVISSRPPQWGTDLTAPPRDDNLKNAARLQKLEDLLHGGRRIQQADPGSSFA